MQLTFDTYDLDAYGLFLKTKALPESHLAYDWRTDAYTIEFPDRFAALLGLAQDGPLQDWLSFPAHLFDYQRYIVREALEAQRYAVWSETGTGKTAMFLEYARQVLHRTNGRMLILSPLQIIPQTCEEAQRWYGETLPILRLATREALAQWCAGEGSALAICNYEKLIPGVIDSMHTLSGLILDEGSVLKSSGGVIKWNLIKSARGIPYKLSCTATPAPNDSMEFASQASFLEKLRNEGEVLWTFFKRDKYGNWAIKPHAKPAFYRFLASWSIYLRNPAHFGWEDILATLPPPEIREYRLPMTAAQQRLLHRIAVVTGSGLFADEKMGVKERTKLSQIAKGFYYDGQGKERRIVPVDAVKPAFVAELARQEVAAGRQVLLWTVFDEESAILAKLLADVPRVTALHGDIDQEARLPLLEAFRHGDIPVLISKPVLLGYGMNFQFCRSMIFSGFDDSMERFYQAIRRCVRFGQHETVHIHIPYVPELEGMIFDNVKQKQARFDLETTLHEQSYRDAMQEKEVRCA